MVSKPNKRSRLMFDVPSELRRRVKRAAAERDLSIAEYLIPILEQAVPAEAKQEGRLVTKELIERFNQTRAAIMHGRRFTDDSADLIHQGREERTAEL